MTADDSKKTEYSSIDTLDLNDATQLVNQSVDDKTQLHEPAPDEDQTQVTEKTRVTTDEQTVMAQPQAMPINDADSPPQVGDLLNGRYQLEKELGKGGMGSVFKALDLDKKKVRAKNPHVAIKLLLPELARDEILVTGFHREAEKSQELAHPNIIKVHVVNHDSNRHYIVMEYLDGEPLNRIIRDQGAMPLNQAWPIIRGMGLGLAHAHEHHIIHNDFKPANVFVLENSSEVKILDFGIASELKKIGDNEETIFNPRTEGGLTTTYASFEMLSGVKQADPRDDVFAFGLVVYELLTGKHPYNRKSAAEIFFEKKGGNYHPPVSPPALSKKQWQLLSQAIAIEQEQRPTNLQKWLDAFDPEHNKTLSWRKILATVVSLLAVVAVGVVIMPLKETPPPAVSKPVTSPLAEPKPVEPKLEPITPPLAPVEPKPVEPELEPVTPPPVGPKPIEPELKPFTLPPVEQKPVESGLKPVTPTLHFGTSRSQYHIGQYLQAIFQPPEDGYVSIIYLSSTGEKAEIFPNEFQKNKVKAGKTYQVPPKEKANILRIQLPEGTDSLIAVFSKQPLPKEKEMKSHITDAGNFDKTGLPLDVIVETVSYQVIK